MKGEAKEGWSKKAVGRCDRGLDMKQRHEDGAETTETNTQLDTYTAGFVVFLFPVPV